MAGETDKTSVIIGDLACPMRQELPLWSSLAFSCRLISLVLCLLAPPHVSRAPEEQKTSSMLEAIELRHLFERSIASVMAAAVPVVLSSIAKADGLQSTGPFSPLSLSPPIELILEQLPVRSTRTSVAVEDC